MTSLREAGRVSKRRITWDRADFERKVYRPAHLPPVETALVGRDGTIWLKREVDPEARLARYQVLTAQGVSLP